MKKINFIRHGDLLLVPVDTIPELPEKEGNVILSGEASNHHHRISGGTIYAEEPTAANNFSLGFLDVPVESPLTHEEHKTIMLPPGKYHAYVQVEYDPQENRRVID